MTGMRHQTFAERVVRCPTIYNEDEIDEVIRMQREKADPNAELRPGQNAYLFECKEGLEEIRLVKIKIVSVEDNQLNAAIKKVNFVTRVPGSTSSYARLSDSLVKYDTYLGLPVLANAPTCNVTFSAIFDLIETLQKHGH